MSWFDARATSVWRRTLPCRATIRGWHAASRVAWPWAAVAVAVVVQVHAGLAGFGAACMAQGKPLGQPAVAAVDDLPWTDLFNGRNLDGWAVIDGDKNDWSVVGGVLRCAGRNPGWLGTETRSDNFRLVVEFRLPAGGDSGVFLRASDEGNPAFAGMEVQLLDDRAEEYRDQPVHGRCGGIYSVAGPAKLLSKPAGEWQTLEIVCGIDRVTTILNGEPATDVDLKAAAEHHAGAARVGGRIGLQNWGTEVEFRRVRIQSLGGPG